MESAEEKQIDPREALLESERHRESDRLRDLDRRAAARSSGTAGGLPEPANVSEPLGAGASADRRDQESQARMSLVRGARPASPGPAAPATTSNGRYPTTIRRMALRTEVVASATELARRLGQLEQLSREVKALSHASRTASELRVGFLRILDKIIFESVGSTASGFALDLFLDSLAPSGLERARFTHLMRLIDEVGTGDSRGTDLRSLRSMTARALGWVVERQESLCLLDFERSHAAPNGMGRRFVRLDRTSERDALFGLSVFHGQRRGSLEGLEVVCGARLVGRLGESVAIRVSFRRDASFVQVRPGWEEWSDSGERGRLAAEIELLPDAQRLILDELRVFVPYAALDLPAAPTEIEAVVSLIDSRGTKVAAAGRHDVLSIPASVVHGSPSMQAPPAPVSQRSCGNHDSVSGFRSSLRSVREVFLDLDGWGLPALEAEADLELPSTSLQEFTAELKIFDGSGKQICCRRSGDVGSRRSADGSDERPPAFVERAVLVSDNPFFTKRPLTLRAPLAALELQPGFNHLRAVLTVHDSKNQVVTECSREFDIFSEPRSPSANLPDEMVELTVTRFEVLHDFEFQGRFGVALSCDVDFSHSNAPWCTVLLRIEEPAGGTFTVNARSLAGESYISVFERRVTVVRPSDDRRPAHALAFFAYEDFWTPLPEDGRGVRAPKMRLVGRVIVLNQNRVPVQDSTSDFFVRPAAELDISALKKPSTLGADPRITATRILPGEGTAQDLLELFVHTPQHRDFALNLADLNDQLPMEEEGDPLRYRAVLPPRIIPAIGQGPALGAAGNPPRQQVFSVPLAVLRLGGVTGHRTVRVALEDSAGILFSPCEVELPKELALKLDQSAPASAPAKPRVRRKKRSALMRYLNPPVKR